MYLEGLVGVALFITFVVPSNAWVNLTNCNLEDIKGVTTKSVKPHELFATHCNIPQLGNAIFLQCQELQTLEISDSKLQSIEDFALNGLVNLRTLTLVRNNISEVKSWSHDDMPTVTSLDLRRNAIRTLGAKSFQRFPNLQKLNLAVNLIETVPYGVFKTLPQLKYLNLGKNLLTQIDMYTFKGMIKLTSLSLHFNQIRHIDGQSFDTNTHLRSLRIEGNGLANLDFMAVINLSRLVHLNLSYNAIESLEKLSFAKDYELRDLDLSYNRIREVSEETLVGLEALQILNITHNSISSIEANSFKDLSSLVYLDVSANNLTYLPPNLFNSTQQLRYVNLSHNQMALLDAHIFARMPLIAVLDLSANDLSRDDFLHFESTPKELRYLGLSDNLFTQLNISVLSGFEEVDLYSNPWDCQWLVQEILQLPRGVHIAEHYIIDSISDVTIDDVGIECFNGRLLKSLIVWNNTTKTSDVSTIEPEDDGKIMNFKTLPWPKIRLDRFDEKSIIIWLLVSMVVVFGFLRIGRYFMERSERKSLKLKAFKRQQLEIKLNDYIEIPQEGRHGDTRLT